MRMVKFLRQSASLFIIIAMSSWYFALESTAQAATCSGLKAELSRLQSGTSGKWQSMYKKQAQALKRARRDARYLRCGSTAAHTRCPALQNKIGRMNANLKAIGRKVSASSTRGNKARVRQIKTLLATSRCTGGTLRASSRSTVRSGAKVIKVADTYRTLPNGIMVLVKKDPKRQHKSTRKTASLERKVARYSLRDQRSYKTKTSWRRPRSGKTYRTLCVRTCDGYFFPISFSTGKRNLEADSQRCQQMCPGAETSLYMHRNPGEAAQDMVSVEGQPYVEMENAFRYKNEYVPGCSCSGSAQAHLDGGLETGSIGQNTALNSDLKMTLGFSPVSIKLRNQEPFAPLLSGKDKKGTQEHASAHPHGVIIFPDKVQKNEGPQPVFAQTETPEEIERANAGAIRIVGPEYFVAR